MSKWVFACSSTGLSGNLLLYIKTVYFMSAPVPLSPDLVAIFGSGWTASVALPDLDPSQLDLPFFVDSIPAGFPSPAQGYEEARLDLNRLIVLRPEATFMLRVKGDSLRDANVQDGDIVVVDRSIEPRHGHIVIAEVGGEFTIKILWRRGGLVRLMPANPAYKPIEFSEGMDLVVFGVVTWILHCAPMPK